uniref:Homing endonuclease n=1 Tax=Pleurotus citrinopileatus TaxID=98342 RepID=A0A2K9YPE3_PLECI|nr:homing endonuclease [Pleurotus citrinopileatus]AUW35255.1 homing endonuclease [Pleurotus citrinopileatus]
MYLLLINKELVILDKLSSYSNIALLNPTRCEKVLQLGGKCSSYNNYGRKNVTDTETIRLNKKNNFFNLKKNYPLRFIHQRLNVGHLISKFSSLKFSTFNINKTSLSENKEMFNQWLVGFTDGDGTFSIVRQNNKWSLTFKIGQSTYNLRILNFIKKQLGVGSLYKEKNNKFAHFRIRDRSTLANVIFPIFDKYPLLTSKKFDYDKFKKAYFILSDKSLNSLEKDKIIFKLLSELKSADYVSSAWSLINNKISNFEDASKIMSKSWLIGFTEAEGSFYLVLKSKDRLVHAFEINQKLDEIVLIAIKHILHISTKVNYKKAGYFSLNTTNTRAIENIINYYSNTMKGIKSLEFRIWQRSYVKNKGNFIALNKIRERIRIRRKI